MTARRHAWLTTIVLILGVPSMVGVGLCSYVRSTSPPVHPDPRTAPSVQHATPSPSWAAAVRKSQEIARALLGEQNLPGLSVAVGVAGEGPDQGIVWAEGFGWANVENRMPVAPHIRFRIGHASKTLTSAGVGVLLEQRRMHLGD